MTLQPWALVSIDDARFFVRYDENDEDALLERMIHAATLAAENYTSRMFVTREITEEHIGNGRKILRLRRRPIVSVSSVTVDGQSLAENDDYEVLKTDGRLRRSPTRLQTPAINPSYAGGVWTYNAIINVTYSAGYGTTRDEVQYEVPEVIQGVLICIARWFENRENLQSEQVSNLGSRTWVPPKEALEEWRRYRVWEGI